ASLPGQGRTVSAPAATNPTKGSTLPSVVAAAAVIGVDVCPTAAAIAAVKQEGQGVVDARVVRQPIKGRREGVRLAQRPGGLRASGQIEIVADARHGVLAEPAKLHAGILALTS